SLHIVGRPGWIRPVIQDSLFHSSTVFSIFFTSSDSSFCLHSAGENPWCRFRTRPCPSSNTRLRASSCLSDAPCERAYLRNPILMEYGGLMSQVTNLPL